MNKYDQYLTNIPYLTYNINYYSIIYLFIIYNFNHKHSIYFNYSHQLIFSFTYIFIIIFFYLKIYYYQIQSLILKKSIIYYFYPIILSPKFPIYLNTQIIYFFNQ